MAFAVAALLTRRRLSWQALVSWSPLLAVVASIVPSLPDFVDVWNGADPVNLAGIWFTVPFVTFVVQLFWWLGVLAARPEPPIVKRVGLVNALLFVPVAILAFFTNLLLI